MQTTFFVPLNEFLRSTIDYSIDSIVIFKAFSLQIIVLNDSLFQTFDEFSRESTPYVRNMKLALLRGNGSRELRSQYISFHFYFVVITFILSSLFGLNCETESDGNDVEGQALWRYFSGNALQILYNNLISGG